MAIFYHSVIRVDIYKKARRARAASLRSGPIRVISLFLGKTLPTQLCAYHDASGAVFVARCELKPFLGSPAGNRLSCNEKRAMHHPVVEPTPPPCLDDDEVALLKLVEPCEGVGVREAVAGDHDRALLPRKRSIRVVGRAAIERERVRERPVEHRRPVSLEERLLKPDLRDTERPELMSPQRLGRNSLCRFAHNEGSNGRRDSGGRKHPHRARRAV
jgi:hypothetical protein